MLLFWSLDRLSREGTVETQNNIWTRLASSVRPSSASLPLLRSRSGSESASAYRQGWHAHGKQGRIGGRPKAEDDHKLFQAVQRLRAAGKSIRQIAAEADISTNTVLKLLRAAEADCVNLQSGLVRAGFSSHTAQSRGTCERRTAHRGNHSYSKPTFQALH